MNMLRKLPDLISGCQTRWFWLALGLWLTSAPVLAQVPDWRNNRLIQPEKVTVGPSDNYQAQVDVAGGRIVYTQHQHLLSRIIVQDLTTGTARSLLPADHDAKDPALSPDRRTVAFTSFRNNALGGICLQDIDSTERPRCITAPGTPAWMPFWFDHENLGYLREHRSEETELIRYHIPTQSRESLYRGSITAPSVSADGRFLVFNRFGGTDYSGLEIRDLHTGEHFGPIHLDVPGISSYALIDPIEDYLYFGHYPADTSGDQRIDAEDHSVIYRLPLARIREHREPLLPEPLTSVQHNCNFPYLAENSLYVTCAFEGSLDIYRLPQTGQIPGHWGAQQLGEAHAAATRYEDRLFLLHTLRYRELPTLPHVRQRLLSNHLGINEFTAAGFYLEQLAEDAATSASNRGADFYSNLSGLVDALSAAQQQPQQVRTARFRQQIARIRAHLRPHPESAEARVFQAWFAWLELDSARALELLQQTPTGELPLAEYLEIELYRHLLARDPEALLEVFLRAAANPAISEAARLYYSNEYLKLLLSTRPTHAAHIARLQSTLARLGDGRVRALFENEVTLLELTEPADQATERERLAAFSTRVRAHREDLLWMRISHIRGIQLLGLAERYELMEWISRHWLTHTSVRHVAFAAIAEQYAAINRTQAYGTWAQGQNNSALNNFYSVIRQTNDLESLYNLIRLGVAPGTEPQLAERMEMLYQQLVDEGLLEGNTQFAQALRILLSSPVPDTASLQRAAAQLRGFRAQGLDPGIADLLLGSILQRQFQASQDGYRFDRDLFQQAHHRYMLALDLAYANPRVQAALLENLGLLHFGARNYGISAEFWGQRLRLPNFRPEDAIDHYWQHARALYFSNRPVEALASAEAALAIGISLDVPERAALQERAAFYALNAGDYALAVTRYSELLDPAHAGALTPNNLVRAQFSHAYALFKAGASADARAQFSEALTHLAQASARAPDDNRLAPFAPQRLGLQAYGFLSQLAEEPEQRLYWLQRRIALLEGLRARDRQHGLDEPARITLMILSRLQMAEIQEQQGQLEAAATTMTALLNDLQAFLRAKGSPNSQPVLRGLFNYLTLAAWHPSVFGSEPNSLQPLLAAVQEELVDADFTPPVNHGQRLKLDLLTALYRERLSGSERSARLAAQVDAIRADPEWAGLALTRPDWHQELEELAHGIVRHGR